MLPRITVITDTEQSPFPQSGVLLPPPWSSSLLAESLWDTVAQWAQKMTKEGKTTSAKGCSHRPWWSLMTHFHSEQRGPLRGPGWECPSDSDSSLLDSIGHTHSQHGLLWTLAFLWTPYSWVAAFFSLDESVISDDQARELSPEAESLSLFCVGLCLQGNLTPPSYTFWALEDFC